jgi:DNA repair protein RadD
MTLVLREYQQDAIVMVKNSLKEGNKRVVVALATGGGKSAICEAMITGARSKGKRVMFLVNRVQLADQMSAHLSRSKIQHGVIQGQNTRSIYHDVVIASIDTIHKRGYPECDLILADEAHGAAGSKKYHKLFEHYKNIPIIGVTATPMAKGLGKAYPWGSLFEDIVCPITIPELIEQGYLVDVDIYAPSEPDLSAVKVVAGDYHEGQLGEAVDKPTLIGDIVQQWKKHAYGKQTIAFAVNIPHSQHIVEEFQKANVSAVHIDYTMAYEDKNAIIQRFKDGEFTVLCNCALLSEGFDAPATECMILARPTKSLARYIQMAGRILRPAPGKTRAIMLDHSGTALQLGFPTESIAYTLCDGKPKQSTGSVKKEERKPAKCPQCAYVKKSGGKCPICGFAPQRANTTEHAEGELVPMTKKEKAKKAKLDGLDKQVVYSELYRLAEERGYKPGWIANQYRQIFGVWPRGLVDVGRPPSLVVQNMVRSNMIRYAKGLKNA